MNTHRKIVLDVVTSPDGARCSEECAYARGVGPWTCVFDEARRHTGGVRLAACIEAGRAARVPTLHVMLADARASDECSSCGYAPCMCDQS